MQTIAVSVPSDFMNGHPSKGTEYEHIYQMLLQLNEEWELIKKSCLFETWQYIKLLFPYFLSWSKDGFTSYFVWLL